jgi:hypothetical protein
LLIGARIRRGRIAPEGFRMASDETVADLLPNRTWRFGRADGSVIAPRFWFRRDGTLGGHANNEELAWRIQGGVLELINCYGRPSTRFTEVSRSADGALELRGKFLPNPEVVHVLRELAEAPPPEPPRRTGRRNLVLMRAGNNALFPSWAPAEHRSWDLVVSFYGDGAPEWGQEYFVAEKGPKWQPIHRWLAANLHLLEQYDCFWFPDDDIMTTWENVNSLFEVFREYRLQLAQPALTPDSFILHAVTREQPAFLLRFTRFVETMVPVLSAEALRVCLPVMAEESRYGWGHDWVMPMLLGYPPNGIAIIDACAVTHTRPCGTNTDVALANAQLYSLISKYGARFADHRVRGCIFREPKPVDFTLP